MANLISDIDDDGAILTRPKTLAPLHPAPAVRGTEVELDRLDASEVRYK